MKRIILVAAASMMAACSGGNTGDDVPPLPEQTAETANALMNEAERAAANAAQRSETQPRQDRSGTATVNEEAP